MNIRFKIQKAHTEVHTSDSPSLLCIFHCLPIGFPPKEAKPYYQLLVDVNRDIQNIHICNKTLLSK